LENTIGKVLESIMAETISYLTEEYQLLPATHFGGRPGRTTEDVIIGANREYTRGVEGRQNILGGIHGCSGRI